MEWQGIRRGVRGERDGTKRGNARDTEDGKEGSMAREERRTEEKDGRGVEKECVTKGRAGGVGRWVTKKRMRDADDPRDGGGEGG